MNNFLKKLANKINRKFIITHIVWDFDGTLYQNDDLVKNLKKAYFSYINKHKKITNSQFNKLFLKLGKFSLVASNYLDKREREIIDEVDFLFPTSSFLKKNKKLVSWIENMDQYQHIILSNSYSKTIKKGLKKIGFKEKKKKIYPFIKIIGRDNLKKMKPHLNAFKEVLKHTKQIKIRHLMIGDSWSEDVHAPKKFGMQSIHVSQIKDFFS
jgi:HAD superfamily hydrolase (TIGR01549 family)